MVPQPAPSQPINYRVAIFFLLDGNYADGVDTKPFAYLYHHSTYIEPDTMPLIYILAFFK
jgi:hypothetical protein